MRYKVNKEWLAACGKNIEQDSFEIVRTRKHGHMTEVVVVDHPAYAGEPESHWVLMHPWRGNFEAPAVEAPAVEAPALEDAVQYVAGIETRWYDAPFAVVRTAPSIEAPDAWDIVTAGQGVLNNWTVWRELNETGGSYIYGEC